MDLADAVQRLQVLEKENRILQKKLDRTERNYQRMEQSRQKAEALLNTTIQELQASQSTLKIRSCELEQALTELKSMQSRLLMTEKMSALGVLVAGIAHEINNPVSFIYGNVNHISEYVYDLLKLVQQYQQHFVASVPEITQLEQAIELDFIRDDLPKVVQSMKMGAERIKQIVLSLRNFSRMDESEFKAVDLHEGLESSLVILSHRLKANEDQPPIEVIRDYGSLPLVKCYAGQMNQVFMNILVNAIDALRDSGREDPCITIRTCQRQDWISIGISDNGMGIPRAIAQQIFDPFFTTKPVGQGTGMGMSISYQIVTQKHGGNLSFNSIPGQGTEFLIEIPTTQHLSTSPSPMPAVPAASQGSAVK